MNDELRRRGEELNDLNGFLESIFASLSSGVIVIDREMRVLVWNTQSEELWGLRAAEAVDRNVLALDVGLPVDQLASSLRAVLTGQTTTAEVTLTAVNRRGRTVQCEVSCSPLTALDGSVRGVIIMVDAEK